MSLCGTQQNMFLIALNESPKIVRQGFQSVKPSKLSFKKTCMSDFSSQLTS